MISESERQEIIDSFILMYPETRYDQFIYRDMHGCIEWICPKHGTGHPIWDVHGDYVHGCCGCCEKFKDWEYWR